MVRDGKKAIVSTKGLERMSLLSVASTLQIAISRVTFSEIKESDILTFSPQ